ncbi:MAG: HU family DNA-binding protein [Balneolaceae bacterium]
MNYSDLIDRLAETSDLPKTRTKELLEQSISVLSSQLSQGNGVSIPDLGTFSTKVKEIKKVYNPHHKSYIMVPPKRVVEFSPSTNLKEKLKFVDGGSSDE